jgi:tRNA(Ile)-lysidine synthase
MIKLLGKIPDNSILALSGGLDSMVALDFILRKRKIEVAFFNHGTGECNWAQNFVEDFCLFNNLVLHKKRIDSDERPKGLSTEEHWRNSRYEWLHSFDQPVITAHHLDDMLETYLYGALHGTPKFIPYSKNNVIRPFLLNKRSDMEEWATKNNVDWYEDKSNESTMFMRNFIRQNIVPNALHVNPGIHKIIRKKFKEYYGFD